MSSDDESVSSRSSKGGRGAKNKRGGRGGVYMGRGNKTSSHQQGGSRGSNSMNDLSQLSSAKRGGGRGSGSKVIRHSRGGPSFAGQNNHFAGNQQPPQHSQENMPLLGQPQQFNNLGGNMPPPLTGQSPQFNNLAGNMSPMQQVGYNPAPHRNHPYDINQQQGARYDSQQLTANNMNTSIFQPHHPPPLLNNHPPPLRPHTANVNPNPPPSEKKSLAVKDLFLVLLNSSKQQQSFDKLLGKLKCSENALRHVCNINKKTLNYHKSGNDTIVEMSPNIMICSAYLTDAGCRAKQNCGMMHICQRYTFNSCTDAKECEFGHNWKTNHNTEVLSDYCLDNFNSTILDNLLKRITAQIETITVCAAYNKGSCSESGVCTALHICERCVAGAYKCESEDCTLNHDILQSQCKMILTLFGIDTGNSKRDVKTEVSMELEKNSVSKKTPSGTKKKLKATEDESRNCSDHENRQSKQNERPSKLLKIFETMHKQEEKVRTIVRSLIVAPNYWNSTEKLAALVSLRPEDVKSLVRQYPDLFIIHASHTKDIFKLHPHMAICRLYTTDSGCNSDCCDKLHVCFNFIIGKCTLDSCKFHHSFVSRHNKDIIKHFFHDGIPVKLVLNYLKKKLCEGKVPCICIPYNEGTCIAQVCRKLHMCYDQLFTAGDCFKNNCQLEHNLDSAHNKSLLDQQNLSEYPARILYSKLSIQIVNWNARSAGQSNAQQHTGSANTTTPKKNQGSVASSNGKSAVVDDDLVWAHNPKGDINVEEICLESLSSQCNKPNKRCYKLHCRVSYHWQVFKHGHWCNFPFVQSNAVENSFRNVDNDKMNLKPLVHFSNENEKKVLEFLQNDGMSVDFDRMELNCADAEVALKVRRVSTPSSVTSFSDFATVYAWFYNDMNGNWIEYGFTDSTTVETHYSTETSTDIEQAFVNGAFGLQITTGTKSFSYTLDFVHMQQTNNYSKMIRRIRRRPKYAVIEKLKPNDPFGLKAIAKKKLAAREDGLKRGKEDGLQKSNTSDSSSFRDTSKYSTAKIECAKKKDDSKNSQQDDSIPRFWTTMLAEQDIVTITVDMSSDEAMSIVQSIKLTKPTAAISKIRRLQNTFHWSAFNIQMDFIKASTGQSMLNIQRLFHGTRDSYVDFITAHNFEWRQSSSGKQYGHGAYFFNSAAEAYESARAVQDSSEMILVIADVLVGTVALGSPDLTRPPQQANTTVNNLTLPTIFVKYSTAEYCPHYFVSLTV